MDLEKVFSENAIRQISTLIAPGALAITPLITWAYAKQTSNCAITSPIGLIGLLLIVVTVGIIIEDISLRAEDQIIDRLIGHLQSKKKPASNNESQHLSDWKAYLNLKFDSAPILHYAIQSTVAKMRFESSIFVASILFLLLSFALQQGYGLSENQLVWGGCSVLVLGLYCGWEAYQSAVLLSDRRHELLKITETPAP